MQIWKVQISGREEKHYAQLLLHDFTKFLAGIDSVNEINGRKDGWKP